MTRVPFVLSLLSATAVAAAEPPSIPAVVSTPALHGYDGAPATPDADDPAIWIHPTDPTKSLVIGTLKDAGLIVYDLNGGVVQTNAPPNLPSILPEDPPTPAGRNPGTPLPCAESQSGEVFGRFNNADVAYGVWLGEDHRGERVDVLVVTDRGCDRLRFYAIDPLDTNTPLTDVTAEDVPRVYPMRFVQPSPIQPTDRPRGLHANPLDDQDTAYGLGLWRSGPTHYAFVSQRNRSVINQLRIVAVANGRLSYVRVRTLIVNAVFELQKRHGRFTWTPCREEAEVDPQSEGIAVDHDRLKLYVGIESIGLYKVDLQPHLERIVVVDQDALIEPVKHFGHSYFAIPEDDEFECEYDPEGSPEPGTRSAEGSLAFGGEHLEANLEGLAIRYPGKGRGALVASSQGDSTFHLFGRGPGNAHIGRVQIEGVEDTDGIAVTEVPVDSRFPAGMLVVHNGKAPPPLNTSDINGYEYEDSTQFKLASWREVIGDSGSHKRAAKPRAR